MAAYTYEHPRPALTVDVVIFTVRSDRLQILLIQRRSEPFAGQWALPGGFLKMEESLDQAAARELEEETGLEQAYLEQLYTFGEPDRDPRGRTVSVAYYALIPANAPFREEGGSDAAKARWFPVGELPALAFDHAEISALAVQRLRSKLESSVIGFALLPEEFTLSELQHTFEIVLGRQLDRREFQRRILEAGIIEPTQERPNRAGRPVQQYRYHPVAVAEVKAGHSLR